ncbi:BPSL0761 family protein [Burkholderia multivorans]|uniref:BPSL0761 family protein n=1 Tax=Burkholderia multivorans TaxID=87883 RepID=UPI00345E1AF2
MTELGISSVSTSEILRAASALRSLRLTALRCAARRSPGAFTSSLDNPAGRAMPNMFGNAGARCTACHRTRMSPSNCLSEGQVTTAYERTQSVVETRKFLEMLASIDVAADDGRVQSVAARLLRHYPLDIDLEVSAAALPGIWGAPQR